MKLVMFDMDGTLLSNMHDISENNRKAFRKLHEKGYKLGIATGRRVINVEEILGEDVSIFDVIIGENGYETKDLTLHESTYTKKLTEEEIEEIIQEFNDEGEIVNFAWFGNEYTLFYKESEFTRNHPSEPQVIRYLLEGERFPAIPKICMPVQVEYATKYRSLVEGIKGRNYHGVMTGYSFFEFMNVETSKWKALEKYISKNNLSKDDVIAFGDSGNDMEILSHVGFAVAMQNADDKVKEICHAITKYSNSEDGVGNYIEEHLL